MDNPHAVRSDREHKEKEVVEITSCQKEVQEVFDESDQLNEAKAFAPRRQLTRYSR